MSRPLVTPVDGDPEPERTAPGPTVVIIFNDRTGPSLVFDIVAAKHAFLERETWETVDEGGRAAYLLVLTCETASAETLFDLIGSRLPDYVQARRFPPTRLAEVRRSGTRLD